jgi:hypothetical protein
MAALTTRIVSRLSVRSGSSNGTASLGGPETHSGLAARRVGRSARAADSPTDTTPRPSRAPVAITSSVATDHENARIDLVRLE